MNRQPVHSENSRSAAVGNLFAALEGLLISYQALPDGEREARWSADAELITGAVALHLSTARGRIAARSRPASTPRPVPPPAPTPAGTAPSDTARAAPIPRQADPTDDRRPA